MPRNPTDAELLHEWREIPSYPDYEVTFIGKVRHKTSGLIVIPFMVDYQEHKGIHVTLFNDGERKTIDVWTLVKDTFKK